MNELKRNVSWVIGDTVIHPIIHYGSQEEWLQIIRDNVPEWEGAFKMREQELYKGVKWQQITKALVSKIYGRLSELEAKQEIE